MTSKTTAHKDAVLEIIDRAAYQGYANESEESCILHLLALALR
jgi:hypothetical protein